MKKMSFRNRWEGICDGECPYWICGQEQQYYRSWLKRTKTLTRFIEADFIITMMSWSYILMSHLFSCKITACKATSHWRQNKLSATNAFKLVYSFSSARSWTAHFLIHSINKNASSLGTDAMAFGLAIRRRRITRGSAASRDVFLIPKISYIIRHCKFVSQSACIFLKKNPKTSKRQVLLKLEKKTRRRKKLSLKRVFYKLDNNRWKMHTGARARKQKYISIYISLCMKTFLKTGVYNIYTRKRQYLN